MPLAQRRARTSKVVFSSRPDGCRIGVLRVSAAVFVRRKGGTLAQQTEFLAQWARVGAAARLRELREEIALIERTFPDLGRSSSTRERPAAAGGRIVSAEGRARIAAAQKKRWAAVRAQQAGESPARRGGMSAAARKAVSLRMKTFWAERRKQKKSGRAATPATKP